MGGRIEWAPGVEIEEGADALLRKVVGPPVAMISEMPHFSQRLIIPQESRGAEWWVMERDVRHLIRRLMSWGLQGENRMPCGWSVVRDPATQNVYLVILAEETGVMG